MEQNVLSCLPSNENSVTTLLRALCVLKPVRDVFVKTFTQEKFGANNVDFEGVLTQAGLGGAIPDMVMQAEDLRIVVEIKVSAWRGLTDNQPETYLKWLANEKVHNRFFVFLAPPNYSAQHFQDYKKRKDAFCVENPHHGINFVEIDWLDVSRALEESGLPSTCVYARDFNHLLNGWYVPSPVKFSLDELQEIDMFNTTAAASLSKIFMLVESIASEMERAGFKNIHREFQKRWWDKGEYGIYIKCQDENVLWFGVWMDLWKDHGCPLCIGVDGKWTPNVVERFRESFPDNFTYPSNGAAAYLTKCIDQHLLMGDAVRDVTNWLLKAYLNGICDIFDE